MTKKDYIMIAAILKARRNAEAAVTNGYVIDRVAEDLAGKLADDNPRFDRAKFLQACGA